MPHVHYHDFASAVKNYEGNLYIRELFQDVPVDTGYNAVMKYIGTPYEKHLLNLVKAMMGKNKIEDRSSLFCSEFDSIVLKDLGIVDPNVNASNVIPELLSAKAGPYDLLKGKAYDDVPLKLDYTFVEKDMDGENCCGTLGKGCLSCCFVKEPQVHQGSSGDIYAPNGYYARAYNLAYSPTIKVPEHPNGDQLMEQFKSIYSSKKFKKLYSIK